MTPEDIQEIIDAMSAGKVPDDKASETRVFLRGWNEGIEFAERQATKIFTEKYGPPLTARSSEQKTAYQTGD